MQWNLRTSGKTKNSITNSIMTMKSFNKVMGGVLGASLLLGAAACSDDHFDIRPAQESAANTIWQNIEANPQLDSLAMILKRVKVYRKETDKNVAQNYAELLNQAQTFTFWAPLNGTYNAKSVLEQLDEVDSLRAHGKAVEAAKLEFMVGQQFVQNHLARFNYESNSGLQDVRLLNAKLTEYNAAAGTFNGIAVNAQYRNVPSSNGTMHVIEGRSPFAYNVFDYFKSNGNYTGIYASLSDSLVDQDTFSPELSIAGAMNENGEMVYVDSVWINSNTLLSNSQASIKNEDSLYVALAPSDKCWDQALKTVGAYFKYGRTYKTSYNKESANVFSTNYSLNADSLTDYQTKMALLSSMYFSPGYFKGNFSRSDSAGIVNYVMTADSLRTTNYLYYYNPTPGSVNPMFAGANVIKASNGYILSFDDYTIDPAYSFQSKIQYNLAYSNAVGYTTQVVVTGGSPIVLTEGVNRDTTDHIVGEVEDDTYRFFQASGQMKVFIPLRNVNSGSYRIKAQILPNRINTAVKYYDPDTHVEVVDRENNKFRCSVVSDDVNKTVSGGSNREFVVNQDSIQTVTLFDKVTFDKCYYGLPTGVESFPVLKFEFTRAMINGMKYKDMIIGLSLGKIYLEPIRE